MKQLLLFDINYAPGVNRWPIILKMKDWQKAGIMITIFTGLEGEIYYKKHVENVAYIVVPFKHAIHAYYDVPMASLKAHVAAFSYLFQLRKKFYYIYSQSAVIDFLFFPWIVKLLDKNVQWFVMVDNLVPPPNKRPGPFLKNLIPYLAFLVGNLLLKKSDGLFVVTNFLKKYYETRGYTVIKTADGYGIDVEKFKEKVAPHTSQFDAIYCGRLHQAKGIFDLIEVIKQVVTDKRKFTLGIMGDGDESTKMALRNKITQYGLRKNIKLLGYKEGKEKIDILRTAELFLFLSYDESCPQSVIEAFAANKLVIAYDLPIYYDVFKKYIKQKELKVFKIGEIKKIANYIIKGEYKAMKFSNDIKDFSWKKITKREIGTFYNSYVFPQKKKNIDRSTKFINHDEERIN